MLRSMPSVKIPTLNLTPLALALLSLGALRAQSPEMILTNGKIITVDEPHPRKPAFVTTEKFSQLRNILYGLLHDEIRKAVEQSATARPQP